MSARLQVRRGGVPDSPYPPDRARPVVFSHFSATGFCVAMPPPLDIFSLEKSSLSNPDVFNRPLESVLTAGKKLTWYFASSLTKPAMSRGLGINRLVPPVRTPSR